MVITRSGGGANVSASPAAATSFTSTFTATANPLDPTKWKGGLADGLDWLNFQSASNVACAGSASSSSPPPYNDSMAILKTSVLALAADQYVTWVIHRAGGYTPPGTHELGGFLRFTLTANNAQGMEWYTGPTGGSTIVRWNGAVNDFTALSPTGPGPSAPADGDVMLFTVVGTTYRAYQNGSLVWTVTDSTYATGQAGLQSYAESTSTFTSYGMSSVTMGNM